MQNLMDNICRCFGPNDRHEEEATASSPKRSATANNNIIKKNDLLKEQGDALMERHLVAQAKQQSHGGATALNKRKRAASRHDIFRKDVVTPQQQDHELLNTNANTTNNNPMNTNPLSRFLSDHPALSRSLCWATPVRDQNEEDEEEDEDACTIKSAADDTIASTLCSYETSKLLLLQQYNNSNNTHNNNHDTTWNPKQTQTVVPLWKANSLRTNGLLAYSQQQQRVPTMCSLNSSSGSSNSEDGTACSEEVHKRSRAL
jgi:hypothetical protein